MDAWVLRKSWSPWTTIGYEIKVARSDFLRDEKWHEYLPVCHELYFVCPRGLIQVEELPAEVGLLWQAKTGTRLFVKRKAVRREPDPVKLNKLMSYVLMSRTQIVGDMWEANGRSRRQLDAQYWQEWLLRKRENQDLGWNVSKRVAERYREMEGEVRAAQRKVDSYEWARKRLEELGLDPEKPVGNWEINSKLERLRGALPSHLTRKVRAGLETLRQAMDELEGLRDQQNAVYDVLVPSGEEAART